MIKASCVLGNGGMVPRTIVEIYNVPAVGSTIDLPTEHAAPPSDNAMCPTRLYHGDLAVYEVRRVHHLADAGRRGPHVRLFVDYVGDASKKDYP